MGKTTIEWTAQHLPDGTVVSGYTFNPWSGCQRVSPGCQNCYAEAMAKRNPRVLGVWGPQGTRVRTSNDYWRNPLVWNREAKREGRRYRVFCASMADVFEDRPELIEWRVDLFRLIVNTPLLDWLVSTNRPENIMPMMQGMGWSSMMDNVWIGATVENQEQADRRIPALLSVPAKVRFLSCEPLLQQVNIRDFLTDGAGHWRTPTRERHWVICGGESGHGARYMDAYWALSLKEQCEAAGVPFFMKQMGSVWADEVGSSDKKGGDLSEMPVELRVRQFPEGWA